jgi:hypothetical protein
MRTIVVADVAGLYAHPRKEIREYQIAGVLHRLARGVYCAVPPDVEPQTWRPSLEAATAAVATAFYGARVPVLTGLTAARAHLALPRAIGAGYVAVPSYRRPATLADRDAIVHFAERDVAELDAVLIQTDLGSALATTPEQTLLDLAKRDPRGEDLDSREAIEALWPQCDPATLEQIAGRQRMRATLRRVARGR